MSDFQQSVRFLQATGVVGEIIFDGPHRAEPNAILSLDAANNVIGRVFTAVVGVDGYAKAGGTDAFAGILVNPKVYANRGIAGDTLAPTLVLPNETEAEFLKMGTIIVESASAAAVGDSVFYDPATGEIGTGAASFGTFTEQVPNAKVVRLNTPAAGLCIIQITN